MIYGSLKKLELQIQEMEKTGLEMSSTEGFVGKGIYDPQKKIQKNITKKIVMKH